jgi:hypothetical protein
MTGIGSVVGGSDQGGTGIGILEVGGVVQLEAGIFFLEPPIMGSENIDLGIPEHISRCTNDVYRFITHRKSGMETKIEFVAYLLRL